MHLCRYPRPSLRELTCPLPTAQVLPTNLTIMVLAAGVLAHGTEAVASAGLPCVERAVSILRPAPHIEAAAKLGASTAVRWGFSHFIRMDYFKRACAMAAGAGGVAQLEAIQTSHDKSIVCSSTRDTDLRDPRLALQEVGRGLLEAGQGVTPFRDVRWHGEWPNTGQGIANALLWKAWG
jgi:hypothetical protein